MMMDLLGFESIHSYISSLHAGVLLIVWNSINVMEDENILNVQ